MKQTLYQILIQGLLVQNTGFVSAVIFTKESVLCLFLQGPGGIVNLLLPYAPL